MKISEIYSKPGPIISFEVFPPKPDTPLEALFDTIGQLKELNPAFISVTYGAGGSSKGRTVEIASRIKNQYGLEAMSHLTCVGQSKSDISSVLDQMEQAGIENILALRGDPPANMPDFDFSKGEFRYASELTRFIHQTDHRRQKRFCIVGAAYPEGHRASSRIDQDWQNLKAKVDAGAEALITQLFFDNRVFYHFLDQVRRIGIQCPIVPGIMPVFNAKQIKRIISLCGASMPADLLLLTEKYGDSADDMRKAGVEFAIKQIRDLLANGVKAIHLEPLNKAELAREILAGIR